MSACALPQDSKRGGGVAKIDEDKHLNGSLQLDLPPAQLGLREGQLQTVAAGQQPREEEVSRWLSKRADFKGRFASLPVSVEHLID